ncbi:MAG: hypothetical protein H7096_10410, partial [Flavobacterium sp.]|nr:hypothetical protein [Pedobacter sp.]
MEKIYSFDVFDTCLVRTFANPADLFYVLVERIIRKLHGPDALKQKFGREEISEIARSRVIAEKQAHAVKMQEDITLKDIYDNLNELKCWDIIPGEMMKEEILIELETARPVVNIRRRVTDLQMAGEKVLFISDMYLPANVIKEMLEQCGYNVPENSLYVSNEIGLTKRSGNLFKYILNKEGIAAKQLLHCGDGVQSDFLGARKVGVKGEIIGFTHLNRFEKAILRIPSERPWIASQIAGISRATRLGFEGHERVQASADIASSVIAPLLTGFVFWVLEDAKKRGLERLYFVARDGQILHKIAQALVKESGGPEVHYLYGSRQAWYLPSAFKVNQEELEFVLFTGQSSAPRHNLKRIKLTPEEFEQPLKRYGFLPESWDRQLRDDEVDQFWNFIKDPEVASVILQKAKDARELALAYFKQEGLLKDDKWAIVDVGWTLRTQGSFKKILNSALQSHTLGYYLGICKARFSALSYGQGRGYLLEEAEDEMNSEMLSLFQNKGLIDQVFTMADHGSTKGYVLSGNQVLPDLGVLPSYPKREEFLKTVQSSVTLFASEIAKASLADYEP